MKMRYVHYSQNFIKIIGKKIDSNVIRKDAI